MTIMAVAQVRQDISDVVPQLEIRVERVAAPWIKQFWHVGFVAVVGLGQSLLSF